VNRLLRAGGKRLALPCLAAVLSCTAVPNMLAVERQTTWSHDIAQLVYGHCSGCHHAGGSGPFPLMSYSDAKRWGGLMEVVTASRYMPPWLPEPGYGQFEDNRRLTDEQIALIKNWVASGMPEGDSAKIPTPPTYASEWQLGAPDLVLEVSSPTEVPAQGTDVFLNLILPDGLKTTHWIRAMEIKPGSSRVVHHANVLIDRTASLRRQHAADWEQGIPGMDITIDGGSSFDPDSHLLFWKPDSSALIEPADMPWRLDPGNDLILNMHLRPAGKIEHVRPRIALYFASAPAARLPMLLELEHDAALDIPAGDAHFVVEDKLTLPQAVDVLAVYPHAHYLGKRMEAFATLPNGELRWIILIKDWDIQRQAIYRLAKPLRLPSGTTVHMRYSYDNSAGNVRNPHNPPIRVHAGNRSEDEMGHLWLQVLPVAPTQDGKDARLLLERAWMVERLRKDSGDSTALYNLASMELESGQTATAQKLFTSALLRKPDDPRLLTALGLTLYRGGHTEEAEQEFLKALAMDHGYADAQFDLARVQLSEGAFPAAEKSFRDYLKANPADVVAHDGLGSALLAQSRADEAQREFQATLATYPEDFDALYNLASIAAEENDLKQAALLLQRALAVRKDADAERLFGLIEAKEGAMTEALAHMQAARDLQPRDAETHTLLAKIYAQMQRWPEAVAEQKVALEYDASHADDWSLLGEVEQAAGNPTAARSAFRKALELDPRNPEALRATQTSQ
jgi:tetratricopeptide (TPR) repeat protein/mono/diheme cytochrome c family protein